MRRTEAKINKQKNENQQWRARECSGKHTDRGGNRGNTRKRACILPPGAENRGPVVSAAIQQLAGEQEYRMPGTVKSQRELETVCL